MTREEKTKLFAAWLRIQIATKDVEQKEMAEEVGIAESTLSKWKRGCSLPYRENILALHEYLTGLPRNNGDHLHPPARMRDCNKCSHLDSCRDRVLSQPPRPIKCMLLDEDDLRLAKHWGEVDDIIWWVSLPEGNRMTIEELMNVTIELPLEAMT